VTLSRIAVRIIPWTSDFIAALALRLTTEAGGDPLALANTTVIFPHNRPARHLKAALAQATALPKPCAMPRMQSLDEFLRQLRQDLSAQPLTRAGTLDRIGLLHRVITGVEGGLQGGFNMTSGPLATLNASAREFFPWGARLASLLEELARHGVTPADLHHLEGEVLPWASALLGQLGGIDAAYKQAMAGRGWTTPGLDALWLASHLDEVEACLEGRRLILAGFYALAGTEETLFRMFSERLDALNLWHSDPALATGGTCDWAVREHKALLRRWNVRAELEVEPEAGKVQHRRLYEGFDLHSQLFALKQELANLPDSEATAIVLPDPGALVPVMHHLPHRDINISMGYPLARSSLAQLVECVLKLHENAEGTGTGARYAWRDLVALVRQPTLRMLQAGEEGQTPLKGAFQAWEKHIRSSGALQSAYSWVPVYDPEACPVSEQDFRTLLGEVQHACLDAFSGLTTLAGLGEALENLCALLKRRGGDIWHTFLIDAECLLRLWQSVVPELTGSILAQETYDQSLLFMILRHLLDGERVSFEPEPLAGMQVLGMLETRLLHFKRLFVLDATEDKLPGVSPPDPLLPDPLRLALGLPGSRTRDNVAAHNFFRLLRGAGEVCVLYQTGTRPGALDGKSVRSRYVEQLLWDEEKRTGELVRPQPMTETSAILRAVSFPVTALLPNRPPVTVSADIRQRLTSHLLTKGITPSAVEDYLACPKLFLFRRVLGLRTMDEVAEDGDRALFGEIVHRVLRAYFEPHLGHVITGADCDADDLVAALEQDMTACAYSLQLPYDTQVALLAAARERLSRFLANMPRTTVIKLEHSLTTEISFRQPGAANDTVLTLTGKIDRVDERLDGHTVLDYKTGSVKAKGGAPWLDTELFTRLSQATPGAPDAEALLAELSESGIDAQLPLYLHLLDRQGGYIPHNAAWVELKSKGEEKPLFGPDVDVIERNQVIRERVPQLLRFLLEHMLAAPELPARFGKRCQWCDYKGPCIG